MNDYLLAILGIFGIMLIGIGVERLYRYFQSKHPELGPYRRRDGGCNCHCPVCDQKDCADRDGKDKGGNIKYMRTILKNDFQPHDSRPQ